MDKWCREYGYATAAINYHFISSEFSGYDIMEDIKLSLEVIKRFAADMEIDREKTMLVGSSAGGHLAILYSYRYADTSPIKPVAVVDYCGPTDLSDENYYVNNENATWYLGLYSNICQATFTELNYHSNEMQERLNEFSPICCITDNSIPTLICHEEKDNVVPFSNAERLKQQLDLY